ncbi:hypothetical protein BR93DRAFT_32933 [Coniochaeta sp. PMI_546]|nr:hypothetical protein BR93DRAFT_32933 [Coniochaeta sp. PMI_546]
MSSIFSASRKTLCRAIGVLHRWLSATDHMYYRVSPTSWYHKTPHWLDLFERCIPSPCSVILLCCSGLTGLRRLSHRVCDSPRTTLRTSRPATHTGA